MSSQLGESSKGMSPAPAEGPPVFLREGFGQHQQPEQHVGQAQSRRNEEGHTRAIGDQEAAEYGPDDQAQAKRRANHAEAPWSILRSAHIGHIRIGRATGGAE